LAGISCPQEKSQGIPQEKMTEPEKMIFLILDLIQTPTTKPKIK
jgi:hypothetical protein